MLLLLCNVKAEDEIHDLNPSKMKAKGDGSKKRSYFYLFGDLKRIRSAAAATQFHQIKLIGETGAGSDPRLGAIHL